MTAHKTFGEIKVVVSVAALLCACVASAAETLLDIDFTNAPKSVDNTGRGFCRGVLPNGVVESFASWSEGSCTTSLQEEDGVKFLRFTSNTQKGVVQFVSPCSMIEAPGYFRLTVMGRARRNALGIGLRLRSAPYTSFSQHRFGDRFSALDWTEQTYHFTISQKAENSVGLYLYPPDGETDLQRIVLEKIDRADVVRSIPRPPSTQRVFVSRRFLLGLPNGWNDDRETATATVTSVPDPDSSTPVLRLSSVGDKQMSVWGEPFQTSDPCAPHVVSLRCRGAGKWSAKVVTDKRMAVKTASLKPEAAWRTVVFPFRPDDLAHAFAVKFQGSGELFIDDLRVGIGTETPPRSFAASCALAADGGEIAGLTRIWFADESPRIAWAVADAPAEAVLKLSFADVYGHAAQLADIPLKGGAFERGVFDPSKAVAGRTGQFRVTAEVVAGGARISAPDEFVFTRIARPQGWGCDMPDSPFGVHMEPRSGTIAAMKACGINWTRLHDAATFCTGWWALEAEKGKWTFHDADIVRFRAGHIKIFAQLGTAPAWATHYNDLGCKNMGYHEKYLRPVDTDAWLNYVTTVVRRYRGVIDEYFVWNEPWGNYWKSAADLKYYNKDRAAQDFGAFQAMTYRAVKSVDPKIVLSGFNTCASKGGDKWSEGVAEGGGWKTCDVMDYHVYTPMLRARRDDIDFASLAFRPILADHPGIDGKKVYMSEGQGTNTGSNPDSGPMSGLYERIVPWKSETVAEMTWRADATCRYTLSLLAAGDARVFLYTAHGYTGLVSPPSYTVLVCADGYPHPALAAYAFLTRTLEGCTFSSKAEYGAAGCVYSFGGGSKFHRVRLYTDLTADEADALNVCTPLRDLYGNSYDRVTWFKGTLLYAFD